MTEGPNVVVLRLGHRPARDKRMTTHVCLAARALGAARVIVSTKDASVERSVRGVVSRFGGAFAVETGVPWRRVLAAWRGTVVHLTMYGEPLDQALPRIPREDVLVVVGAEKVPGEVFGRADFNVAVGNQPHSEDAAGCGARSTALSESSRAAAARSLRKPYDGPTHGNAPRPCTARRSPSSSRWRWRSRRRRPAPPRSCRNRGTRRGTSGPTR